MPKVWFKSRSHDEEELPYGGKAMVRVCLVRLHGSAGGKLLAHPGLLYPLWVLVDHARPQEEICSRFSKVYCSFASSVCSYTGTALPVREWERKTLKSASSPWSDNRRNSETPLRSWSLNRTLLKRSCRYLRNRSNR